MKLLMIYTMNLKLHGYMYNIWFWGSSQWIPYAIWIWIVLKTHIIQHPILHLSCFLVFPQLSADNENLLFSNWKFSFQSHTSIWELEFFTTPILLSLEHPSTFMIIFLLIFFLLAHPNLFDLHFQLANPFVSQIAPF